MSISQEAREVAANRRELIALLRREGEYSGVWFSDKLFEAAAALEATLSPPADELREKVAMIIDPEAFNFSRHEAGGMKAIRRTNARERASAIIALDRKG